MTVQSTQSTSTLEGSWLLASTVQPGARDLEVGGTESGPVRPLGLTRANCPDGSLHDHIVKQWGYIRSYVIKGGHLFLSLMADGGIYEFEPIKKSA